MDGTILNGPAFRTPPRILIPKLVASRDGWKLKAGERKRRLKAARIRIRDLETSRDLWRERARAAEEQARESKRQWEETQQALANAERLRDESKKK
jgi:hypothetical protein